MFFCNVKRYLSISALLIFYLELFLSYSDFTYQIIPKNDS